MKERVNVNETGNLKAKRAQEWAINAGNAKSSLLP
jgi:hypothetical protein